MKWQLVVTYWNANSRDTQVFEDASNKFYMIDDKGHLHIEEGGERIASFAVYISVIKEQVND